MIDWGTVDRGKVLSEVLARLDVQVRAGRGGWQPVRCPNKSEHANGDRNPSAQANLVLGKFLCHACGLRGDGFDLGREFLGKSASEILDDVGVGVIMSEGDFLF